MEARPGLPAAAGGPFQGPRTACQRAAPARRQALSEALPRRGRAALPVELDRSVPATVSSCAKNLVTNGAKAASGALRPATSTARALQSILPVTSREAWLRATLLGLRVRRRFLVTSGRRPATPFWRSSLACRTSERFARAVPAGEANGSRSVPSSAIRLQKHGSLRPLRDSDEFVFPPFRLTTATATAICL
jgi:hypothetical protein